MALTTTKRGPKITKGNVLEQTFALTFTSVTGGEVSTGFRNVISAIYSPTTSDDHGVVYPNSASASATEDDFGSVYVDGVTSNDTGILVVTGI